MTGGPPILTSDAPRWSVSLGRWTGIPVLFHGYFVAVLVVLLIFAASFSQADRVKVAFLAFGIWVASAILHEVAHLYICRHLQGVCHLLVFSPLGGHSIYSVRGGSAKTMMVYAAGPLANLCVALVAMLFLLNHIDINELLNPFEPRRLTQGDMELISLKLFFFINWFIFLTNLLPVFPLDSGYILAEAIRIEPPSPRGPDLATEFVGRWSVLASAAAFAAAFWRFEFGPYPKVPTWVVLASFGAYVYLGAKEALARCQFQRRRLPSPYLGGLAFQDDHASPESVDAARVDRWLRERPASQLDAIEREVITEEEEDLLVDQALERLHRQGYEGLTPEERDLLRRASERYRRRHRLDNSDDAD